MMHKPFFATSWVAVIVSSTLAVFNGCAGARHQENMTLTTAAPSEHRAQNPLLAPWSGPYGGVPGFAGVQVEHFKPALEQAMAETRSELDAITRNAEPPSLENTSLAFEDSGRKLGRVHRVYHVWESTLNGPEFQALDREMSPKLAAFADEIIQNEKLFRRLEAVYNTADKSQWSAEQQRLVWRQYTDFVLAGAKLGGPEKARLGEINQRLASLYTAFGQNVLSDEETYAVIIETEAELEGLPESIKRGAAAAAEERKQPVRGQQEQDAHHPETACSRTQNVAGIDAASLAAETPQDQSDGQTAAEEGQHHQQIDR